MESRFIGSDSNITKTYHDCYSFFFKLSLLFGREGDISKLFPTELPSQIKNKNDYLIYKYTGNEYRLFNQFLRDDAIPFDCVDYHMPWLYYLYLHIRDGPKNIENNTIVYRGICTPFKTNMQIGYTFMMPGFISTTLKKSVALGFNGNKYLLIITLTNLDKENYCRYIKDISMYPQEEEVLLNCFCNFRLDKIEGNVYYLTCLGPIKENLDKILPKADK